MTSQSIPRYYYFIIILWPYDHAKVNLAGGMFCLLHWKRGPDVFALYRKIKVRKRATILGTPQGQPSLLFADVIITPVLNHGPECVRHKTQKFDLYITDLNINLSFFHIIPKLCRNIL